MMTRNILTGLVFAGLVYSAGAQTYSIDWHKIAGGGGTSTGGVYSVSGTIGQHDATADIALTGGGFSLTGGFWALPVAVQVTGAPTLNIVPDAPGTATISWSPNTPGFTLQESPSLTSPAWTNAPSGTNNPVTVPATQPMRYYRLNHP